MLYTLITVIDDIDLDLSVGLSCQRIKCPSQRLRIVLCPDQDRDQWQGQRSHFGMVPFQIAIVIAHQVRSYIFKTVECFRICYFSRRKSIGTQMVHMCDRFDKIKLCLLGSIYVHGPGLALHHCTDIHQCIDRGLVGDLIGEYIACELDTLQSIPYHPCRCTVIRVIFQRRSEKDIARLIFFKQIYDPLYRIGVDIESLVGCTEKMAFGNTEHLCCLLQLFLAYLFIASCRTIRHHDDSDDLPLVRHFQDRPAKTECFVIWMRSKHK